jgi:N-acetylneuraminate synthase
VIIESNVTKYAVFAEDSVASALTKISENKCGIVFAVSHSGYLEGAMSDGDFRRWVVTQSDIDIGMPVQNLLNRSFVSARDDEAPEELAARFSDRIRLIPLVDGHGRLVGIARREGAELEIGPFRIGERGPAFLIAEIGNNHNGSFELACRLVDEAISVGADCVKFQHRNLRGLYRNGGEQGDIKDDLGAQYTLDLLNRFQLKTHELLAVFDYAKGKGILPLCTPWDALSFADLEQYGLPAFKVASADLTNHELLSLIAKSRKPILCSTGMSTEEEILQAVQLFRKAGTQYALLHCNSTYPAPFKDVNLRYLARLRQLSGGIVGYSGHERGYSVAIAAVAMGARIIEKHFTLDRGMEGNDHRVSLLPHEFAAMVRGIREVEQATGSEEPRKVSQGEMMNREVLAKSLVAAADIDVGTVIEQSMIEVRSPGNGMPPYRRAELVGRKATRKIQRGDFFYPSDLLDQRTEARDYCFKRPFGIPVRYHDLETLGTASNFSMLEFHLSYRDLEEDPGRHISRPSNLGLVVHSPELFSGDHVLDLCSDDDAYWRRSIAELQKVIAVTRAMAPMFAGTKRPSIVVNVGGFSQDGPRPVGNRPALYRRALEAFRCLDLEGVELIPQTMPPFPWHFGGQRFHNLFMDADEIVGFCRDNGFRICLDISHSYLYCNYAAKSFSEFLEKVGPYTAHMHVVDAMGVDDEGLQIGAGAVDFEMVAAIMRRVAPGASFIPEIWQGHKDDGAGFWAALDKLERWF